MTDSMYIEAAIAAVREASELCAYVQRNLVTEDTLVKKDRSPVTVADFSSQAVINYTLGQRFPGIPITAEEGAFALRQPENGELTGKVHETVKQALADVSREDLLEAIDLGNHTGGPGCRFWTVDPIDGTKGFIRGEQYAVALALIESGEPVLGVLGCPNLPIDPTGEEIRQGCIFAAVKGSGAVMMSLDDGDECGIHVTPNDDAKVAVFCESVESGHTAHGWSAHASEKLGTKAASVRLDSQCKYAVVARGEADIYMRLPTRPDYEEKIWDHAAGALIITEAGGRVTDVDGRPLDFSRGRTLKQNRGVIATNGALHETVLSAVREAEATSR